MYLVTYHIALDLVQENPGADVEAWALLVSSLLMAYGLVAVGRPETRDPVVRKRGWEIPHQNIIYMKYIYI